MVDGAGLENRSAARAGENPTPTQQATSDDRPEAENEVLAKGLHKDPELAEIVSVWKLLDEPIRQAILALVRVKHRG